MDYRDNLEIDLIDLCHYLLRKWRTCLIFMLVGMVAFGAVGAVKSSGSGSGSGESGSSSIAGQAMSLTESEIEDVNEAVELYFEYLNLYTARQNYVKDSVRMNVDPNNVSVITEVFLIRDYMRENNIYVSDINEADNIVELYKRVISSSEVLDEVQKALGWSVGNRLVRELFSLTKNGLDVMVLTVYGPDEDTCRTISGILEKAITDRERDIQRIQDHKLEILNTTYSQEYVSSFADAQKTQADALSAIEKSMNAVAGTMADSQSALYTALVGELRKPQYETVGGQVDLRTISDKIAALEAGEEVAENDVSASGAGASVGRMINKKYILIGALAGIFLMLLIYSIIYIFTPSLKTGKEISGVFRLSLLGGLAGDKKAGLFSGVDRFVDDIFAGNRPRFSESETLDMICSAIFIGASKESAGKIFVTGTTADATAASYMNRIVEEAGRNKGQDKGPVLETGRSPLFDPRSLENLSASDAVVFVEKIGTSRYEDMAKLIELCQNYNIKILGAVVVDR